MKKRELPELHDYSEDVQELIGKPSSLILWLGIPFVLVFVFSLLILSCCLRYPEYITIDAVLRSEREACCIRSTYGGEVTFINTVNELRVECGDTLAIIAKGERFEYLISPQTGTAYRCDVVKVGDMITRGIPLFIVQDTASIQNINGVAYVSDDIQRRLLCNMSAETFINGISIGGYITDISSNKHPDNKGYAVRIHFPNVGKMAFTEEREPIKIKVVDKTIFERFILEKMDI